MACVVTGEISCKCDQDNSCSVVEVTEAGTMRKLWTDHANYTKFALDAIIDNNSSSLVNALIPRLMTNQEEIGEEVARYVGQASGQQLAELLKTHIKLAAEVMKAVKANSRPQTNKTVAELLDNSNEVADHIAVFTGYDNEFLRAEFKRHNMYVLEMTQLRHAGDHVKEYQKYDAYYNHMMTFSDIIYSGISCDD